MKILNLIFACFFLSRSVGAAETASFLNVGAGGRALAMGGAYTALGSDASSIYWNPAGLAGVERHDLQASHAELGQSARHDFLAYAQSFPIGSFAGSATYLSRGALDGRDELGHQTASFQASDAAVSMGYARKAEIADLGADVKYVRSHIGSAEAQTAALDAGARKTLGAFSLGAAVRNIGRGMRFGAETNELPLRLAFGAAYKLAEGHALAAEVTNAPRGGGTNFGVGGEYQVVSNFFLRAGYTTLNAVAGGTGFEAAGGLTVGLGYGGPSWTLDYAAVPMGQLGSTHRFTLGAHW